MPLPAASSRTNVTPKRRSYYVAPPEVHKYSLPDLLDRIGRGALEKRQLDFLKEASPRHEADVFYAGDLEILDAPTVSIVGTREVSEPGWRRASQLARDLVKAGVTVVSGLAKGVDTAALTSAIANGGRVAAVIGTPLDKAYPAENAELQHDIYRRHVLLTPFEVGERVFRSNFPTRNRVSGRALRYRSCVPPEPRDALHPRHTAAMTESGWGRPFDEPIEIAGRKLVTLTPASTSPRSPRRSTRRQNGKPLCTR